MRKIINKTKLALAFLAMLWQVVSLSAQPTVYGHPQLMTTYPSLVREYSGTDLVAYHYPYFAYIEDNSPYTNVIVHDHLPSTIRVCDMEIFEDVLYFCGVDTASMPSKGIYGYVPVSELADLVNPADIYYADIPDFPNIRLQVTAGLKLEVFKARSGDYHIVMVGDCELASGLVQTRCLMDALSRTPYANPAQWTFEVAYEPMLVEYFTDVAVTDNYVVTDAQKYGSGAEYMRFFDKPVFMGGFIFNTMLYQDIYMPENSAHKFQSHYITALPGDEVATTTIAKNNSTMKDGLLLTHINCVTQSVISQSFLDAGTGYDTKWRIKDITHDRNTNNLYILARVDINSGGLYDYIIDIPSFPPIILPPSFNAYTTHFSLHSLAPLTPYYQYVMAIGDDAGYPRLYQHQLGTQSLMGCDHLQTLAPDSLPQYMTRFPVELNIDTNYQSILPQKYINIPVPTLNINCQ